MAANTEPNAQQVTALIGQLARLADAIDDMLLDHFAISAAYRIGRESGEKAAREALLGRAAGTTPARPRSGARPHLRGLDGGAS